MFKKSSCIALFGLLLILSGCGPARPLDPENAPALDTQASPTEEENITGTKTVDLYVPNYKTPEYETDPCDPAQLRPLSREVISENPLRGAIQALLSLELTEEETKAGFISPFRGQGLEIENIEYNENQIIITFVDPRLYTTGGSCRVLLLSAQIKKTIQELTGVEEVIIKPDYLFQP